MNCPALFVPSNLIYSGLFFTLGPVDGSSGWRLAEWQFGSVVGHSDQASEDEALVIVNDAGLVRANEAATRCFEQDVLGGQL